MLFVEMDALILMSFNLMFSFIVVFYLLETRANLNNQ